MKFFTVAKNLSDNKSMTAEGFLLCKNVCIARLDQQEYSSSELNAPVVFVGGKVLVSREREDLFSKETIASYENKTFTLEHPDEDVNSTNWQTLTIGIVQNVRVSEDTLVADILINDSNAVDLVLTNRVKGISCGYDCDYVPLDDGYAKQINIRGNHVSLVRNPRSNKCKIKDSKQINSMVHLKLLIVLNKILEV